MKNKRYLKVFVFLGIPSILVSQTFDRAQLQSEVEVGLSNLPFAEYTINLPQFPTQIFDIREYGAVGDGQTLNTTAIQNAIVKCARMGGGTVLIPSGLWLTGPLQMHSRVNLHLQSGALVVFTPDRRQYPMIKIPRREYSAMPLLYGYDLEDVAVTGEGILNGSGEAWRPVKKSKTTDAQWKNLLKSGGVVDKVKEIWWPSQAAMDGEQFVRQVGQSKRKKDLIPDDYLPARDFLRPNMVQFINCRRVLFDGITVTNSPRFALYPNFCEEVVIRNVKINNEWWAQNGDGIDLNACRNALVYRCTVTAGDDALCLKASLDKETIQPAVRNIVMRDCTVYHGHGGFVVGSNTEGGVANVFVENCTFIGTDLGLRFKSARDRGGIVENIFIKNITMQSIVGAAVFFSTFYQEFTQHPIAPDERQPVTTTTPIFRNIVMDSIFSRDSQQIAALTGLAEMPLQNIRLTHSAFTAAAGVTAINVNGLHLEEVNLQPAEGTVLNLQQCSQVLLDRISYPKDCGSVLTVAGAASQAITVKNIVLDDSAIVCRPEVPADAVRRIE